MLWSTHLWHIGQCYYLEDIGNGGMLWGFQDYSHCCQYVGLWFLGEDVAYGVGYLDQSVN